MGQEQDEWTRNGKLSSPLHSEEGASYTVSTLDGNTPNEVAREIVACPAHWTSPRSQTEAVRHAVVAIETSEQQHEHAFRTPTAGSVGVYGGVMTRTPPTQTQQSQGGDVVVKTPPGQERYPWQEGHNYQSYRDALNEQRKRDYNQYIKVHRWPALCTHSVDYKLTMLCTCRLQADYAMYI